ncbi:hypothetical protein JG687_00010190 [Phytophthora cactorum]|uniref:Necrosis inducing protein n=1 Tax=Phytophthora cactorum TaxID=29920 RepID=A0A8T1UA70_9STRA|nr:hypothetical protein JG687_00010190 [Phytophthora cactorum]
MFTFVFRTCFLVSPPLDRAHSLILLVEMKLQALATALFAALVACATATVDHDKIEPFPQPEPVTITEKTAVKFKPQLHTPESVCVPYPADLWAIMYAWYFPKGFWTGFPTRRHDWESVVVWIDNPDLETPKIVRASMSRSDTKYYKQSKVWPADFAGFERIGPRYDRTYIYGSNTSLRFHY